MRRRIGKTRTKLASLLSAELKKARGIDIQIDPEDFWIQEGAYRHITWDLARWGIDLRPARGVFLKIYSWDTMTDCVREGIEFLPGDSRSHNEIEVSRRG